MWCVTPAAYCELSQLTGEVQENLSTHSQACLLYMRMNNTSNDEKKTLKCHSSAVGKSCSSGFTLWDVPQWNTDGCQAGETLVPPPPSLHSQRHPSSIWRIYLSIDSNFGLLPYSKKKTFSPSKVVELEWEHHTFGLWWDIKRKLVSQGKLYRVFQRETALKFISVKMRGGGIWCARGEGRGGLNANINAA